jgi:uncharacterized protein HemY
VGRLEQAKEVFKNIEGPFKRTKTRPLIFLNLAGLAIAQGQHEEARTYLGKALMLRPGWEPALKKLQQLPPTQKNTDRP